MSSKITTYSRKDFFENWEEINKTLSKRWDEVVKRSPHKELKSPTLTDIYLVDSIVSLLSKYLPKKNGLKFLKFDLYNEATATTGLADWFLTRGYDYFGVDISKEVVKLAKLKFAQKTDVSKFKVGDIRDLPFKTNTFDVVFSFGTIEHIRETELAVKEAFRVLAPGGIFISGVNNKLDLWGGYLVNEILNNILKNITSYEPSYFSWEQKQWFVNAGFVNIKISGMIMFPRLIRYADLFLEWRKMQGPARILWNNLIIKPLVVLAKLLEKSEFLRHFCLQTVAVGFKPGK